MAGSLEFVTQRPPRWHPSAPLSPREREVLDLALTGMTAGEIAEALVVTEATVRSHLARIYAKLGVRNRTELVLAFEGSRPEPGDDLDPRATSAEVDASPEPPRRQRVIPRWLVVGGLVVLAVVLAAVVAVMESSPPSVTVGRVSAAIDGGQVVDLRLVGTDLTATTRDGQTLHAAPVTEAQFAALDTAKVDMWSATAGPGTEALTFVGMAATAVAPAIAVVVVLLFLLWFTGGRIGQSRPDGDGGRSVATG